MSTLRLSDSLNVDITHRFYGFSLWSQEGGSLIVFGAEMAKIVKRAFVSECVSYVGLVPLLLA